MAPRAYGQHLATLRPCSQGVNQDGRRRPFSRRARPVDLYTSKAAVHAMSATGRVVGLVWVDSSVSPDVSERLLHAPRLPNLPDQLPP